MRFGQKMTLMHRLTSLSFGLAVAGVTGCGGGGSEPNAPSISPAATTAVVVVTPSTSRLSVGSTLPLRAQAEDASGQVVSNVSIFWSSSDTTLATVSSIGVVTARAVGSVQIAASAGGQSAVAVLAIVPVPVASVSVIPGQATVATGDSLSLNAVAYNDAGAVLTGRGVIWGTSAPQVATVDGSGKVRGVGVGTVTITATSEGKSGAAAISVTAAQTPPPVNPVTPAPVASVSVIPGSLSLTVGQTATVSALTLDADRRVLTGRAVSWVSGNSAVASVDASGLVRAVGAGSTTITASSEGKTGSAQVTITAPAAVPVASVAVTPSSGTLAVGGSVSLSATTRDASGATLSGRNVAWSSSAPQVATVSSSGVVTAVAAGTATISASSEGRTGSASITVQAPAAAPVASVSVTPGTGTITVQGTLNLSATTRDASGSILSGRTVTWSSNTPQVATVSQTGVVTAVAPGNAMITATSEGRSGSASITVQPVPVASVTVSPGSGTLDVGGTLSLMATTSDASGGMLSGRSVAWSSSNSQVATVSSTGVVSAVSPGSTTITATSEGKSGSAAITVRAPVASITITPPTAAIRKNQSVNLTATLRDASGNVLSDRTVEWSVSGSGNSHLSITSTGPLTATATGKNNTGSSTVIAVAEGKQATAVIIVSP